MSARSRVRPWWSGEIATRIPIPFRPGFGFVNAIDDLDKFADFTLGPSAARLRERDRELRERRPGQWQDVVMATIGNCHTIDRADGESGEEFKQRVRATLSIPSLGAWTAAHDALKQRLAEWKAAHAHLVREELGGVETFDCECCGEVRTRKPAAAPQWWTCYACRIDSEMGGSGHVREDGMCSLRQRVILTLPHFFNVDDPVYDTNGRLIGHVIHAGTNPTIAGHVDRIQITRTLTATALRPCASCGKPTPGTVCADGCGVIGGER